MTFSWRRLFTDSVSAFLRDNVPRLGASLAFYTTFSIAPLLVISIAVAGAFFGREAIQGQLKHELIDFLGKDGAEGVQAMIAAAGKEKHVSVISSILGIVTLLIGATAVFAELKSSLNVIWQTEAQPASGIWAVIRDRILSFAMMLSVAFLLLVSLILSAVLSAVSGSIPIPALATEVSDFIVSSIVVALLFMLIFKYLPDAAVRWREVWLGAIVTAILFSIGKYLIGAYLGNAAVASSYGAAGSLVVFLLWSYYSAQILFFGAEFTHVYAEMSRRQLQATARG